MHPQNGKNGGLTVRQDKFSKAHLTLYACGVIPVVWLALLLAPYMGGGLAGLVRYGGAALDHPFHIIWCEDSLKTVLIFMLCYGLGIGVYLSTDRNYRRREEHGSAKWGDPKAINRKYSDKEPSANKILTQNVAIGLDGRKHRRNLNVLVVGGSGAGKTRFYAKPNIMNANTSLIVLDCKGEILRDTGGLLEASGYNIKVLDLINMEKSHCYNPFDYLRNDNDIQRMVTNLFKNTTPKGAQSQDPFWDQAAQMLLLALVFYLHYEAPEEEQNFPMVMEMIRAGEVREDDDAYRSPLDELFDRLEMQDPEHIALKYYRNYRSGSGVVCSKRLLNQAVGKSLRTHNPKSKKGAQVMRKNEKITALYERLSRDDFGKDDDQQRESNSISNQKAMLEEFAARQGFTNIVHFTDDGISGTCFDRPGFLAIVDVSAGQDLCLVIKICQNNTLSIFNGKERIVFAVDKTNHTIIPVRIRKSKNAHDIYRLVVGHRASPLSFFGVVRFFSYSASFAFAHSGSLFVSATPRTSVMSHRHRSPEYNSSK